MGIMLNHDHAFKFVPAELRQMMAGLLGRAAENARLGFVTFDPEGRKVAGRIR